MSHNTLNKNCPRNRHQEGCNNLFPLCAPADCECNVRTFCTCPPAVDDDDDDATCDGNEPCRLCVRLCAEHYKSMQSALDKANARIKWLEEWQQGATLEAINYRAELVTANNKIATDKITMATYLNMLTGYELLKENFAISQAALDKANAEIENLKTIGLHLDGENQKLRAELEALKEAGDEA